MNKWIQKSMLEKKKTIILVFLGICVSLLQIKYIFTELNIDTEYAIAMSWRMLRGDQMFKTMLEPHQTSAFLMTILMKIYVTFVGGNEGIVIFLNFAGVFIHGLVVFCIYKSFQNLIEPFIWKIICMLFMLVHPKGQVTPEFSNMMFWSSALLLICLFRYFNNQTKKKWLLYSSIFLCLQVVSYPSCIVLYLFVLGIIIIFSKKIWTDIIIFTSCCAIWGGAYLIYFINKLGICDLINSLKNVLEGDKYHGEGSDIYGGIFTEGVLKAFVYICINFLIAYVMQKIFFLYKEKQGENNLNTTYTGLWFVIFCVLNVVLDILMAFFIPYYEYDGTWINLQYIVLIIYFSKGIKYLNEQQRRLVMMAYIISLGTLLAVCTVTNLSLNFSVQYMLLAIVLSFIAAKKWMEVKDAKKIYIYIILLFTIISFLFKGFLDVREVSGVIKAGPARGIFTEYMNAYRNNCNIEDWAKNVNENDSILIVGQNSINALGYLIGDTVISAHSTMCGPTYNETMLEYWANNPDKYPDVIAVECWYGELKVNEDSWIMQWIQSEYQPNTYEDGYYYRFYRLKQ